MRGWLGRAAHAVGAGGSTALAAVSLAAAVLLAACGGGEDLTKAHVRLVNASGGSSTLALSIGDKGVASGVAYAGAAGYNDVDPSGTTADVTASGSASVVSTAVALSKKRYYTVLGYGKAGALQVQLLDDNATTPDSGKALVRVINTAADAGSLDVYLTGASDALSSATALQSGLAYGALTGYSTIASGTWRLRVTAAGSKSDLRLDVSGLSLASEGVVTVVLSPGRGGVLVNGLLLAQQSGLTNAANAQARVRVVAGAAGGASVSAHVGGTALMTGVGAPSLTAYALLNAGSVAVAASVNGTAAALGSVALAGGGDYTLMVYGSTASPLAVLLEDDNTPPSSSSQAKLRLVHGIGDVPSTLALKVDFVALADAVAQGSASAYAALDPSTTAQLAVSAAGSAGSLLSTAADQTFVAGANYSYFVVGSSLAPVGILRRDR